MSAPCYFAGDFQRLTGSRLTSQNQISVVLRFWFNRSHHRVPGAHGMRLSSCGQALVGASFSVGWAFMLKRGHALLDFKTISFALVR